MRKKKIFSLCFLLCFCIFLTTFTGCSPKNDDNLIEVNLNEVVRSTFYAPMYVAINEGFFKEEGLDIKLSTGQGADGNITKAQV